MMNHHPKLFVFRETHWIVPLFEAFGTGNGPGDEMLDIVHRTRHVTGTPVTEFDEQAFRHSDDWRDMTTVASFADSLGHFIAKAQGKQYWADKTPDYGAHAAMLQLNWPDCRFIHLIRDGVDTARSMSRHCGYQALAALKRSNWCSLALDYMPPSGGFEQAPLESYAALWHNRLMRIRDEANRLRPGSYLEVFHEAILADPRAELLRIARHVNIEPDQSWLDASTTMIDRRRGRAHPANTEMAAHFHGDPGTLLTALGYRPEWD
jgi:hypothetical protein